MIYKLYRPVPVLQEFIKNYHLLHFDFRGQSISAARSYFPRAEQCLTFDIRGQIISVNKQTGEKQIRPKSYLSQQQTSTYDLAFSDEYIMLKVVFRPGALYRLYGIPLQEFGERYVDAALVLPSEMNRLSEQLANAGSYRQMIITVEQYLLQKIKGLEREAHPLDRVEEWFDGSCGRFNLDELARQSFLSPRQLQRKFLERIGVSPIVYYRILRFNQAVQIKENDPSESWASIALRCGYTDAQHLIKDFRYFSGTTPAGILKEEANSVHRKLNLG
jgi:AraC-like DNA-binding protein